LQNRNFFTQPYTCAVDLLANYKQFLTDYHSPINNRGGINSIATNYKYWHSKRRVWPHLTQAALWWSCICLSSIAAERTFGIARLVDSTQRGRLSWAAFTTNLKFRVNAWVIEEMLEEELKNFR